MAETILKLKNLKIEFPDDDGYLEAVRDIEFTLNKGERLGIVGESGCGKSITCKAILRLLGEKTRVSGEILFKDQDVLKLSISDMYKIRGKEISMIFQEPMASLDPLFTVGDQLTETLMLHRNMSREEAWKEGIEMMKLVSIPQPEKRMKQYPFEFSGGMCQRIMIAIGLACHPEILIADEPTTALDVTIQAQILDLMKQLNKETGTAIILITHDLGVIAETVERVLVLYAGNIVEEADVHSLFHDAKHPYTIGLLASIPKIEKDVEELDSIPGTVPSLKKMPAGCRFAPRCPYKKEICEKEVPCMVQAGGSRVRCWKYSERWEET